MVLASCLVTPLRAAERLSASALFSKVEHLVFQVRVIDISSDDKTAIGSGFLADMSGHVATNYHVISLIANEPKKYRLVLVANDGSEVEADVIAIDVLQDLAIVKPKILRTSHVSFAKTEPRKGERIYSIGNPQDLGMSIVEGNFNGLVKSSRFKRLLFSGSLNPGMSGGPAFNEKGELIGINVATGGEQISFLVPVIELQSLLDHALDRSSKDLLAQIADDLYDEQEQFYSARIKEPWKHQKFGELNLPQDLSPAMKCWGHNEDEEEEQYQAFHQHCQSEEYIYLKDNFYTGNFSYDFEWMSTQALNALQFYSVAEQQFNHPSAGNAYREEDVTEFSCETNFVEISGSTWRTSTCVRQYKNFPRLVDATLLLLALERADTTALIKMSVTGISWDNARSMIGKMMKSISWAQ